MGRNFAGSPKRMFNISINRAARIPSSFCLLPFCAAVLKSNSLQNGAIRRGSQSSILKSHCLDRSSDIAHPSSLMGSITQA
jgi:hypothetical protein